MTKYQVIEDNAGGMFLFFFNNRGRVILGLENIEHVQPGDLRGISLKEAKTWDGQLDKPQKHYDSINSFGFGHEIVADQDGIYPDRMGRSAQIVYQIEAE